MKRAVAYGRYSTDMQREESIDAQFRAIRDYCDRNKIELISTYADEGISGTTDNRPEFQRMIKDAELGAFDYVIVHKLDRFSRSKYDSAIYKRKLKLSNVQLLSVLENLDGSPESLILESVLEGMSEYYSRNLSREVKKGKKENALKCKFNGGTPPLGYDVDKDKNYVINPYEAEIVKIIFNMYGNNHGYKDIMDHLNSKGYKTKTGKNFTRNSFFEILRNEKYIGTYVYSKEDYDGFAKKRNYHRKKKDKKDMIYIKNGVPAILDQDTWDKAQLRIEKYKHLPRNIANSRYYILTGLLFCAECGSPMSGNKLKNSYGTIYYYYKCNNRVRTRTCKSVSVRAEKIEKQVLDCFDDVIFTKHNKDEVLESMMLFLNKPDTKIDKTAGLKKELQEVNKKLDNILNAILNGISSPTVQDKLNELENKKKVLTESIAKNESKKINLQPLEKQIRDFLNSHDSIYNFTPREQSTILKAFIDRIEFKDGSFTIKLKMMNRVDNVGAKDGTWTHTTSRPPDFESGASANSATLAF